VWQPAICGIESTSDGWTNRSALIDRDDAPACGRELAAIAGAVLAARQHRIPVLLDGFVATAAILPLACHEAGLLDHRRAGHVSAESGHRELLRELRLEPLLDLGMRPGEASGAAVAILLSRAALACHGGMATFAEAGVSSAGG
jgi:nicotinate-nucleotide--dimethylbenzimidazole phosphoribosyltransferase